MSENWETIIISAVDDAHMPKQAHPTDAGYDVYANANYTIAPHWFCNVWVWVKVAMPMNTVCLLLPRSSLFKNHWLILVNSVGVVDAWYRWEIGMQLLNLTDREVILEHWDKIWQLLFVDLDKNDRFFDYTAYNKFDETYPSDRWANWFWSTGK